MLRLFSLRCAQPEADRVSAETANGQLHLLDERLSGLRQHVAEKYISKDEAEKMEARIVAAVGSVGERTSKDLSTHAARMDDMLKQLSRMPGSDRE
ncbi:hypothetical protein [Consotaella salsifontis]|uniref:hypothetical protein n=1 Tax=Consotaella salsifontis TaxID=1365950 RepID=UPI000999FC76|nr:hypothetical protein [Consotaella salsifontis]